LQKVLRQYNRLRHFLSVRPADTDFRELAEIRSHASTLTDIDEHLELMFIEGLLRAPKLIVELGVRSGASTCVFERVARCCGSVLISADLEDCSGISSYSRWHFHQGDDVAFAALFPKFCGVRDIAPSIDLLFMDTSHYYDHTVEEIAAWFPLLSPSAKVIFHDTNLRAIGPRKDGCFALGWDNQRGVIRAIEEFLGIKIDEQKEVVKQGNGWLVRHWPNCNGLTILDRLPPQLVED
jgi:cephalosporin hydroxylase